MNILSMLSDIFDKLTCIFTILLVCGRSDGAKLGHDVKEGQIHADAMVSISNDKKFNQFNYKAKVKSTRICTHFSSIAVSMLHLFTNFVSNGFHVWQKRI